jgi:hypothetical protein
MINLRKKDKSNQIKSNQIKSNQIKSAYFFGKTNLEKYFDFTVSNVRMCIRVMDKNCNLLGTDFLCSVTKDEQHGVNHIAFAAAIGSDNGSETFMKGSKALFSSIRFEIFILNM